MSTAGVAPAGAGASVLGVTVTREVASGGTPAFTGHATLLFIAIGVALLTVGIVLVFVGRRVIEPPIRELGVSCRYLYGPPDSQ